MEKSVFAISTGQLRNFVDSLGDDKPVVLITYEKDAKEMLYMTGADSNGNFDIKVPPTVVTRLGDKAVGNE